MVKNAHGGNKSKGLARKQQSSGSSSIHLPSSDDEFFAVVTKMLGNGMFYAIDIHQKQFLGHIRNKFKGRSKHHNIIQVGNTVLLGFRHWEAPHYKNVDLIACYDHADTEFLLKSFHLPQLEQSSSITHDILFADSIHNNHLSTSITDTLHQHPDNTIDDILIDI